MRCFKWVTKTYVFVEKYEKYQYFSVEKNALSRVMWMWVFFSPASFILLYNNLHRWNWSFRYSIFSPSVLGNKLSIEHKIHYLISKVWQVDRIMIAFSQWSKFSFFLFSFCFLFEQKVLATVFLLSIRLRWLVRQAWANSVDPDQMPKNAAFDQGLHCSSF